MTLFEDEFERYEPVPYQLMAAANDLINGDGFVSLSDPRCILYMKDEPTGKWFEVGKTERIKGKFYHNVNIFFLN